MHGGVVPWWLQGSIVTYTVAPRARSPAAARATASPCRPPASAHSRIRIELARHDAHDAGLEQRFGAGRRRAVVVAGLHRHVDGRAAGALACRLQGHHLAVPATRLRHALADDLAVGDDNRADGRLRVGDAERLPRELECSFKHLRRS